MARACIALDACRNEGRGVGRLECRVAIRAREFQELTDDAVHFLDVGDHAGQRGVVARFHLDAEPQSRERCAKVVRDTGQQQRAILLELAQVRGHPIHAAIEVGNLRRPAFR